MERDYDNANGFKTWGMAYNGCDRDTVYMAREDGCACRSIEGRLVQSRLLYIGLRSKLRRRLETGVK
jgi:hypothetical protein